MLLLFWVLLLVQAQDRGRRRSVATFVVAAFDLVVAATVAAVFAAVDMFARRGIKGTWRRLLGFISILPKVASFAHCPSAARFPYCSLADRFAY